MSSSTSPTARCIILSSNTSMPSGRCQPLGSRMLPNVQVIPLSTNLSALFMYPLVAEKLLHGLGVVGPAVDGFGDRRLDVTKLCKHHVCGRAADLLEEPLHGVELGRVGRQEDEREAGDLPEVLSAADYCLSNGRDFVSFRNAARSAALSLVPRPVS